MLHTGLLKEEVMNRVVNMTLNNVFQMLLSSNSKMNLSVETFGKLSLCFFQLNMSNISFYLHFTVAVYQIFKKFNGPVSEDGTNRLTGIQHVNIVLLIWSSSKWRTHLVSHLFLCRTEQLTHSCCWVHLASVSKWNVGYWLLLLMKWGERGSTPFHCVIILFAFQSSAGT